MNRKTTRLAVGLPIQYSSKESRTVASLGLWLVTLNGPVATGFRE